MLQLGFVSKSAASPPPPHVAARLEYVRAQGADTCPADKDLRAEVARNMGYDPFSVAQSPLRVVATITRIGDTLYGAVEIEGGTETRRLYKPFAYPKHDCPALVAAMGLAIGYHLDPLVHPSPRPPAPPSLEALPMQKGPRPPPLSPPAPSLALPFASSAWQMAFGAGSRMTFGATGPALGVVGQLELRRSDLSLFAELQYDLPRSASADGAVKGASVRASRLGSAFALCGHESSLFGCALVVSGVVSISSKGVDSPYHPALFYIGAGLRVGADVPLGPRFSFRFYGEGVLALRTARGVTLDGIVVSAPSLVSFPVFGALYTGVLMRF